MRGVDAATVPADALSAIPSRRRWERPVRRLLPLVACLALGCVTNIGPDISDDPDRDPGPFPERYESIVRRWIQDEFRRLSQVERLSVARPQRGFARPPLLGLRGTRYGWWSRVTFRARDRLGAPTGSLAYSVLIRDGEVIAHQKLVF
jgi:hypothetical protein